MIAATEMLGEVLASDLVDDPARSPAAEPVRAEITARRRRRWGKEAVLAAVTLGALGGFGAITRTITGTRGNAFDRMIVRAMGRARHPATNAIMRGITFFGGVVGATGASIGAVWLARRTPRLASQVVVGAVGGITAELLLKRLFRRQRPALLPHLERVTSTSFPSGHSMSAASLYLSLAFVASRSRRLRAHRALMLAGGGAFASMIGATRVFLGVHWPTDVLGGLALGTAWACAAEAVFDLTGAERIEREAGVAVARD
jgi:undecaprenyl-diphosphatase